MSERNPMIYGVRQPTGAGRYEACSMMCDGAAKGLLSRYHVPDDFGVPTRMVAWFDKSGRIRFCVAHFHNGKQATVWIGADGTWETSLEPIGGTK